MQNRIILKHNFAPVIYCRVQMSGAGISLKQLCLTGQFERCQIKPKSQTMRNCHRTDISTILKQISTYLHTRDCRRDHAETRFQNFISSTRYPQTSTSLLVGKCPWILERLITVLVQATFINYPFRIEWS